MKYLLDTSVYVAMAVEEDIYHDPSVKFARSIVNAPLLTPTIVIAEVLTIVSKLKPSELTSAYRNLLKNEIVQLDLKFLQSFFKRVTVVDHLKASDLVIVVTASIHKTTLVTWDKGMLTYAGALCDVASPKTLLSQSIKA